MNMKTLLLLLALLPGLALATAETDVEYAVQKDVSYTPADWPAALQADLWRPAVGGPKPACS